MNEGLASRLLYWLLQKYLHTTRGALLTWSNRLYVGVQNRIPAPTSNSCSTKSLWIPVSAPIPPRLLALRWIKHSSPFKQLWGIKRSVKAYFIDMFPLNSHPMTSSALVDLKRQGFIDKVFWTTFINAWQIRRRWPGDPTQPNHMDVFEKSLWFHEAEKQPKIFF